jgi:carbamoyl-phosphate synthase large subunit
MASLRKCRVLITACGTVTAQSVMKGLRHQAELPGAQGVPVLASESLDVDITGADASPLNAGRYFADRFAEVPRADDPGYLDALLQIVRAQGIQLLVPIFDGEFALLARERHRFEALSCAVAISAPDTIAICNQKDRTARFFADHGFPAPRLVEPADARAGRCRFPLVVKPREGRASIGVRVAATPAEVERELATGEDLVLQEWTSGREVTVDVLCDLQGELVGLVPRERLEIKAGVSSKGRTLRDAALVEGAARMARLLRFRGPANIQGFLQNDGQVQWIEINPRFSGALPLTIAAGLNGPLLLAHAALGDRIEPRLGEYAEVRMLRYWEEVFTDGEGRALARLPLAER